MSAVNWKKVAPKRDDWMRLSDLMEKRGLSKPSWINGTPTGLSDKDLAELEKLVTGKVVAAPVVAAAPHPKKAKAKPVVKRKTK